MTTTTESPIDNEVKQLAQAGLSREDIATELGISSRIVNRALGVDITALIARYNEKPRIPVRDIADEFFVDIPKFYDILKEHEVPLRTKNDAAEGKRKIAKEILDLAVNFYCEGIQVLLIQRDTDVSPPTLYAELRRRGIALRQQ